MGKTNRELLGELGITIEKIRGNSGKTLCPKCSHTRKNKNDLCLSVNVQEGIYNCHNTSCGWSGKVFSKTQYVPKPKEYIIPPFVNTTKCSDSIVNWFFKRGITQQTLNKAQVTESMEWMPGCEPGEKIKAINFNYFREGKLVNTKFRANKKTFRLIKGAELIFYGLDNIKDSEVVVITEGEPDALSFIESGVDYVVSVPNGASMSSNVNLEYLDNCIDYFKNKKTIIIATDDDEPGRALREELARRLGYHRCYKVNFNGLKDANDYLQTYGPVKLKDVVSKDNLIEFPISGIITADMEWENVSGYIKNGISRGVTTGTMPDFDKLVSFYPGHLMAVTGIPNHGKSPFVLMIMASLSLNHGWKWGFYTPEHKPLAIYLAKICELLLGRRIRKGVVFSERENELVKDFITEHFIFIEPEGSNKLDSIIEISKELVLRKGIKGLVIDPWNKIEHDMDKGENETTYISRQLDNLIKFNQTYQVFSIVIAHPTKIRKDLKTKLYEIPNLYDIAGSSNWFNKPDWGITFYRNYSTGNNEVYVQKAKWEHLGSQGNCELRFNVNNSRFSNLHSQYDNSNWMIPKETQSDLFENKIPEKPINFDNPEEEEVPF